MEQKKKWEIVAISDTHGKKQLLEPILGMKGDIFIHGGDFTYYGCQGDFKSFFQFLDKLTSFRHKIVIAGNHEIMMDSGSMTQLKKKKYLEKHKCTLNRQEIIKQLKKRCIYLQHQTIQLQGLIIFGSPWTPMYCGSAFQYNEKMQKTIWDEVPEDVDLLLTHGPPEGICDLTHKGKNAGSQFLQKVARIYTPKYHIFGHIHEAGGIFRTQNTTFINVAKKYSRIILTKD